MPSHSPAPPHFCRDTGARARAPCRAHRPHRWRTRCARSRRAASRTRCRRLTIGSSTAPVVPVSARPSSAIGIGWPRPRPRKRDTARFPLRRRLAAAVHAQHVERPRAGSPIARGRRLQRSAAVSATYSVCTKSFPKAGCARSSSRRPSDNLGVARDLDLAHAFAPVGERQPAYLHVVFGRHHHVELYFDAVVETPEGGLFGGERDQVFLGLPPRRQVGGRPDRPDRMSRR